MTIVNKKVSHSGARSNWPVTSLVVLCFANEHKQTTAEPPSETKSFENKYKMEVLSSKGSPQSRYEMKKKYNNIKMYIINNVYIYMY